MSDMSQLVADYRTKTPLQDNARDAWDVADYRMKTSSPENDKLMHIGHKQWQKRSK